MNLPIYLDYHATTPCDPRVVEAMMPCFGERFGNPSSGGHVFGREAEDLVEEGRHRVAGLLGARPAEVVFTSGATEANNLALLGVAHWRRAAGDGDHVVGSVIEHKSVIEPLHRLEREGFEVSWVEVDRFGMVDPGDVANVITDRTILVSVMLANNEIATVQPLPEISAVAHEVGAWVHTDGVQGVGKIPVDVNDLGVDLLSLTAHKFYGPKGIGALYVRRAPRRVRLEPAVCGGGQERGIRSGTHNVPGIVGLGMTCEIAERERESEMARLGVMRDRLEAGLKAEIEGLMVNGDPDHRLANSLSVTVPDVDGEAILLALEDIAVSSGSACDSSALAPSHVMTAIGHSEELARSTVRFGLGRWTTEEEIDFAIDRVSETIRHLKSMTALP